MLLDYKAGDWVVIEQDGVLVWIEIGSFFGGGATKKRGRKLEDPEHALVTTIDPDTLEHFRDSWRMLDAETEVVALYQSCLHRRMLREMMRQQISPYEVGEEVDPALNKRKTGEF